MNPSDDVYMKPSLEEHWQLLAEKCSPYPTGEDIQEVYWRTLIGNKRSTVDGNDEKPPDFWRNAYSIWQELSREREGMLPRLLQGKGLKCETGWSNLGSLQPVEGKDYIPISNQLCEEFRKNYVKQQRISVENHLAASGLRAVISAFMSISQNKEVNPNELNDPSEGMKVETSAVVPISSSSRLNTLPATMKEQVANWLQRYPDIQSDEKARLIQILDPATGSELGEGSKPVDRADIEPAFSRDLFRIARNRQFCTTKKRYTGWCPFNAKHRDRICILFGGQIPYVVRKEGKGYRLLGEA